MFRQYLFILMFAWWLGGTTFYALVVIPTAERVLESEREIGFVTRQVTIWLNLSAIVPLMVFLWNTLADRAAGLRWQRRGLTVTWLVMALALAGLFVTHAWLSQTLDVPSHRILHRNAFEFRHNVYEGIVTVQWLAALTHMWLAVSVWNKGSLKAEA